MEAQAKTTSDDQALEAARRVLTLEARALNSLGDSLDASFSACLELLDRVTGRIVVTGMGKSGHIARKIAATLASTGSPAQFVHPGEASHGDLGMIAPGDAVVALSNSGATAEMSAIVGYSRLRSVPLIAVTSKRDSSLAEAADIALILPPQPEACPMGLAPTTSTTMMMALGDAIAVALLDRKGFTKSDFQVLHPGGAIGRKRGTVHKCQCVGREIGEAADRRAHAGTEARILEHVLRDDRRPHNIAVGQRTVIAKLGEQVAAHQSARRLLV